MTTNNNKDIGSFAAEALGGQKTGNSLQLILSVRPSGAPYALACSTKPATESDLGRITEVVPAMTVVTMEEYVYPDGELLYAPKNLGVVYAEGKLQGDVK
jgi:hypothetical protein